MGSADGVLTRHSILEIELDDPLHDARASLVLEGSKEIEDAGIDALVRDLGRIDRLFRRNFFDPRRSPRVWIRR